MFIRSLSGFWFLVVLAFACLSGSLSAAPLILAQPTGKTAYLGDANVAFQVLAAGSPAPTYQWQVKSALPPDSVFVNVSGATAATLTIPTPNPSVDSNQYRCVVTSGTSAQSASATLKVYPAPVLSSPVATVSHATIASDSAANITIQVTGLPFPGATVRIERILDFNGNTLADPGEPLVQSFQVTDGQATWIGGMMNDNFFNEQGGPGSGVRNLNIPGDDESGMSNGRITTHISLPASPELGRTAGSYLIRISSPTGAFRTVAKTLAVTQPSSPQSVSGQVTSGGSPVPYAGVTALLQPDGKYAASAVSSAAGNYTLNLPAGTYALVATQEGYVASTATAPTFALSANQTLAGTNITLTPATCTISGKVQDVSGATNLKGVQLSAKSSNGAVAVTSSDSDGNYVLATLPGQWEIGASDVSMNALGYLRPGTDPSVSTTAGGTTALDLSFTPATSMVYGTVKTPAGAPMPGVLVESADRPDNRDELYSSNVKTGADGKYFLGMAGTTTWRIRVNQQAALSPYIMPDNRWIDPSPNTATYVDFSAIQVTAHLQGTVTKNGAPVSGVNLTSYVSSNDIEVSTTTNASGYFDLGVMAETWYLGIDEDWAMANQVIWPDMSKTIAASQTISGIVYELKDATGTITGNVKDAFGNPFTWNNVYAYARINDTYYNTRADPDSNGNYSLPVLSGYDWFVSVDASGFNEQTVAASSSAPVNFVRSAITDGPSEQSVSAGQNATFSVTVNAPGTPSFQWQRLPNGADWTTGWSNLTDTTTYSGATTDTLTVHNTTGSMAGDQFRCAVSYSLNGTPTINTSYTARLAVVVAHLLGTVTKNGTGVPGLSIYATANNNGWAWATTDASGNFDLGVSGNGTWNISADSYYVFTNNLVAPNLPVTVANSQNVTSISYQLLDATGTISGSVKDSVGKPVTNSYVWAFATVNGLDYNANAWTNASGDFSLPVIAGTWTVGANNFANQTVAVTGSAQVNFTAPPIIAHLLGTVTKNGTGVSGLYVYAYPEGGSSVSATTDASGNFDLGVTSNGTWYVNVDGSYVRTNNLLSLSLPVTVANGQNVTSIAYQLLAATGTISGSVKDSSGNPIPNAYVWAYATINGLDYNADANADGNGNYSLPVINGTWNVGANSGSLSFSQQTVLVTGSTQLNFAETPVVAIITPSTVAADSVDNIAVSATGLAAPGDSVLVERILDLNGNGVADAGEPLVQSFAVTDGQVTSFGGVRNPNIPGDDDGASNGQITTHISLPASPEMGRTAGSYLILISSPTGKFTTITKTLAVTQPNYGQSASGQVTSGSSPVSYAVVSAVSAGDQNYVASTVADATGNFSLNLPAAPYLLVAVHTGYLASMTTAPAFTLAAGQTLAGKNPVLTASTCSISGNIQKTDGSAVFPGVQVSTDSNGFYATALSDASGNYTLPVVPGKWNIDISDQSANALGYLNPDNSPSALATAGQATVVNLSLTPATALIYGTVRDPQGNPLPGVTIYAEDDPQNANQLYFCETWTDADGKYFAPATGGVDWRVKIDQQPAIAPYVMPNDELVTPVSGGATLLDFSVRAVTAHIKGTATKNGAPLAGIIVEASSETSDVTLTATTDASGAFDLGVIADSWWIGLRDESLIYPALPMVTVSNGQTLEGQSITILDPTGTITGIVKDPFGNNPFTDEDVYAYSESGPYYEVTVGPGPDGSFSLPVLAGIQWWIGSDGCGDDQAVTPAPNASVTIIQSAITNDPNDQAVPLGQNATFSVTVYAPSPTIQWQRLPNGADEDTGWVDLANDSTYSGATTATLTVHNAAPSMTGDQFRCVVTYLFNGTTPVTNTSDSSELIVVTAHLRGTVTKNGVPVSGLRIGAGNGSQWFGDNYTDASGNFDIGVTGNGNWYISVDSGYAASHNIVGPNLGVPVSNNQDVSGIAIPVADSTGTIGGQVVDANGNPVSDTGVWGNASIGGNNYWGYSNTDPNGNYSFPAIDGTWNVGVNGPLLFTQQTVAVTGSATVNFAQAAIVGHLQGTVTKNGVAAPGVSVTAWQNSGGISVTTDANGNFDFSLTATGTWNIGLENNYAISHNLVGARLTQTVIQNQTISNIALPIADATGTISGNVKDSGGNALAQAGIWANATINGVFYFADARTDANGNYSLPVINATWTVGVGTASNFAQQSVAIAGSSQVNFTQRAVVAHLTGTVTKNGVPVSGVTIFAGLQGSNNEWTTATSAADGSFDLGVTSNGTWNVSLEQNYANSHNLVGALIPETVSNNQSIANIALQVADGTGTISGTVKDPNGNALANISVFANAAIHGINFNANAQTDSNGNYSFPVIDGTWTVGVGNAPNFAQQMVAFTGSVQVDLNQLAVVAHLQGTVTKNGVAAPGILVTTWQDSMSISATTDANGYFDLGVTNTGTWNIGLEYNYGLSHNLVGARLTKTVTQNQTLSNIALPIADVTGTISGSVKDSGGNPLAQAGVFASATITNIYFFADATTDSSGNFSLPVIDGTWNVGVGTAPNFPQQIVTVTGSSQVNLTQLPVIAHLQGRVTTNGVGVFGIPVVAGHELSGVGASTDADGYFDLGVTCNGTWSVSLESNYAASHNLFSPILQVAVTNSQSVSNIALQIVGSTATISGSVKDAEGNPLTGVGVNANATINGSNYFVYAITDSIGNYSYPVINGTWTLGVNSSLFFPLQTVSVAGSTQVNFAPLAVIAHLQGKVTKKGVAVSGLSIGASLPGTDHATLVTTTDSNGNFDLGVPLNGSWRVGISIGSESAASRNLVGESITEIVENNQSITNIAYEVVDGTGTISGRVTDPGNSPLALTGVYAQATINNVDYYANAQTDINGNYSFPVINGTWTVRVVHNGISQKVVAVTGSAQVDFALLAVVAHLQGKVTKNGIGVPDISLFAWQNSSGGVMATTDANGNFDFGVTNIGAWNISVEVNYASLHNLVKTIPRRTVANNQTITNIPVLIADATGLVYGTVRDATNTPITEVFLDAFATINGVDYYAGATTDSNGNYSFPVINGTWDVGVSEAGFNRKTVPVNGSAQVDFAPSSFAAWQTSWFTTTDVASGLTTPTADFDHDGIPNLLEYAFGKNPKVPDAAAISPNVSGNKLQVSFPCDAICTDVTYTVQASSNLSAWTDIAKSVGGATTAPVNSLSTVTDSGLGQRTVTVTETATFTGRRFLRVKVTTP